MLNIHANSYEVARRYMIRLEEEDFSDTEQLKKLADIANMSPETFRTTFEGTLQGEPFSNESLNWQSRLNNTFKLWSSTQIQFNTSYTSPSATAQGEWAGYFSSDLSIRQDIISNILSLTLQVRDVFGTAKREYTSQGTNLYNYNYYDMKTPLLVLNLRYTFNNYKPKQDNKPGENGNFEGGEEF